ncbi:ParB N-terminal domain-containing protein [Candidatus Acetothermia bacterium]|nr:ParB N-terminal domain-containing protein [Candidatus Acetothermia bacterium]MBI3643268.1 ParB N-terminal domain-containing protein [Candidatus Acetothermia bacterium]
MTRATLPVDTLRPHEEVDPTNLARTIQEIKNGELLQDYPILVDEETYVILDGHHRHAACKALGIALVPCLLVDYEVEVELESRRPEIHVSKTEVIRRGLSGELYPPKSTRHYFVNSRPSPAGSPS